MPNIYSIEGNIGSGKTTIMEHLEKSFTNNPSVVFVREPVDVWQTIRDSSGETILEKFYRDPAKYAFPFQVMAYSSRLSLLRDVVRKNPECETIICERSLDADKHIFAKMLYVDGVIDEVCYQIYKGFYTEFQDEFRLNGIVYIDADPEVCKQRIEKRARQGEDSVSLEYLNKCAQYHETWLNDNELKTEVLRIKTNEDVNYDMTCPHDKGLVWIMNIMDFVSSTNREPISPSLSEEEFGRSIHPFEEYYNPNL